MKSTDPKETVSHKSQNSQITVNDDQKDHHTREGVIEDQIEEILDEWKSAKDFELSAFAIRFLFATFAAFSLPSCLNARKLRTQIHTLRTLRSCALAIFRSFFSFVASIKQSGHVSHTIIEKCFIISCFPIKLTMSVKWREICISRYIQFCITVQ